MTQIMIDTDSESIAGLMLLSRLLTDYANMRMVADKAAEAAYPVQQPTLQQHEHNPQLAAYASGRVTGALPELAASFGTPDTVVEPDPTKLFGKFPVPTGTNVVPLFPQPVLNLPGATGPAVLGVPTAPSANSVPVAIVPSIAPSLSAANVGLSNADVDSQGIPWDERIHSSSKKKKGDGTWILKRGVDHTLAQAITAELITAKLGAVPIAVAATVAITSPIVSTAVNPSVTLPPASAVPVFPGATGLPAQHTGGAVPVPGGPGPGAVPSGPVNPVTRFREMMGKISAGLAAKTITQAQVTEAHKSPGIQLEQLQQAVLFPDKIPLIEAALGLS